MPDSTEQGSLQLGSQIPNPSHPTLPTCWSLLPVRQVSAGSDPNPRLTVKRDISAPPCGREPEVEPLPFRSQVPARLVRLLVTPTRMNTERMGGWWAGER